MPRRTLVLCWLVCVALGCASRAADYPAPIEHDFTARDFHFSNRTLGQPQKDALMPLASLLLIPTGPDTRGHGTHTVAAAWKDHLAKLLTETQP